MGLSTPSFDNFDVPKYGRVCIHYVVGNSVDSTKHQRYIMQAVIMACNNTKFHIHSHTPSIYIQV